MEQQKNFLIPEHKKLSEKDIAILLEKYKLEDKSMLPKIKSSDKGLESLEAQPGDVIQITRTSFAGESNYYRVVVE